MPLFPLPPAVGDQDRERAFGHADDAASEARRVSSLPPDARRAHRQTSKETVRAPWT